MGSNNGFGFLRLPQPPKDDDLQPSLRGRDLITMNNDVNRLAPQWVIYFNAKDYPGKFVVRKFWIGAGKIQKERECQVVGTLLEARKCVPPGRYCLARDPDNDPVIVEVWV